MAEAEESLRKLLKENPQLAKAFKETLDELSKPENIKKMADDICTGINIFIKLRGDIDGRTEQ